MNLLNVDGLPLAKLKEKHVVIVLRKRQEFEKLAIKENNPVFVDDQKAYFFRDKNCFVFFHNNKALLNKRGEQDVDLDK